MAGAPALELLGELGLARMSAAVEPTNDATEVDVVVTHLVSGSCPQVRLDGLSVDRDAALVEAQFTDIGDLLFTGACTDDGNPVVYWLAVERDFLPVGQFPLFTEKDPAAETTVDFGGSRLVRR